MPDDGLIAYQISNIFRRSVGGLFAADERCSPRNTFGVAFSGRVRFSLAVPNEKLSLKRLEKARHKRF